MSDATPPPDDPQAPKTESFSVSGDKLMDEIKRLVKEGNARKITVKNDAGKTLLEIPLSMGLVGVVLLPFYAAIGAVAALATRCTIVVERRETSE
ncbi:MAG: DUF4342 domain-containing protein [Nitrospirae bacterium]|nr:DUF4342 domain-containing protein [Fimbriimonadaceae bacterium]